MLRLKAGTRSERVLCKQNPSYKDLGVADHLHIHYSPVATALVPFLCVANSAQSHGRNRGFRITIVLSYPHGSLDKWQLSSTV